jgi:hypothetical protein
MLEKPGGDGRHVERRCMTSRQLDAPGSFRVAVFQRRPLFDDIGGTTVRLLEDMAWCQAQDVDLAVFPECHLQEYGPADHCAPRPRYR